MLEHHTHGGDERVPSPGFKSLGSVLGSPACSTRILSSQLCARVLHEADPLMSSVMQVFKSRTSGKLACYCWLNTAALDDSLVFQLEGSQLDKVRLCPTTSSNRETIRHF